MLMSYFEYCVFSKYYISKRLRNGAIFNDQFYCELTAECAGKRISKTSRCLMICRSVFTAHRVVWRCVYLLCARVDKATSWSDRTRDIQPSSNVCQSASRHPSGWRKFASVSAQLFSVKNIALHGISGLRSVTCHMGSHAQCYLPPDTGERATFGKYFTRLGLA